MGRARLRAIQTVDENEDPTELEWLQLVSASSTAILAVRRGGRSISLVNRSYPQ